MISYMISLNIMYDTQFYIHKISKSNFKFKVTSQAVQDKLECHTSCPAHFHSIDVTKIRINLMEFDSIKA